MKVLRTIGIGALTATGIGFITYRFFLKEEARERLAQATNTIRESYAKVNTAIEDMTGLIVKEEVELPNQEDTKQQWATLGY